MISKENIRLLDELGLEYIIGVKLRQKKEVKTQKNPKSLIKNHAYR